MTTPMTQLAVDSQRAWTLLEAVSRSTLTHDPDKETEALLAALVYAFEAIEILEARIRELERKC